MKSSLKSKNNPEYTSGNSSISTLWNEVFEIHYYYYNGKIAIAKEIVSLEVQKMAIEYGNWIITCCKKSKTMFENSTEGTGSNVKSLRRIFLFIFG